MAHIHCLTSKQHSLIKNYTVIYRSFGQLQKLFVTSFQNFKGQVIINKDKKKLNNAVILQKQNLTKALFHAAVKEKKNLANCKRFPITGLQIMQIIFFGRCSQLNFQD